jgi:hypothetical protein
MSHCIGSGFGAVIDTQFREDAADIVAHGSFTEEE